MTNGTTTKQQLMAWAPSLALMATIVGAAWGLAWSLSGSLARLEGKVESNAQAIERNAQAGQYVEHARRHDEALASR